MPIKPLNFNTLTAASPYTIGSAPDNLVGYTKPSGSSNLVIVDVGGTKYFRSENSSNAVFKDDTVLTGAVRKSRVTLGITNGNSNGSALLDGSDNGYVALTSDGTGNTRLFKIVNSQLGAQVGASITKTHADNQVREIRWETGGIISLWDGATQIGTNFSDTTYTPIYAGALSRGGFLRAMESEYVSAYQINTFTDPIIPGAAASGTQTGYVDGAITADFGGIAFTGTVSGSSLSGSVSSFVDGGLCPLLPAASVSGTFTQGGNTANLTRAVSVPTGLQELRDGGGSPANFAGLVLGDPKYLGQPFADAGNPLTTNDRAYWDPAYGFLIDQDGRIRLNATDHPTDPVPSLPYTTTIWIRRGADGRVYSHSVVISESGAIVVTPSVAPRSRSLLRVSGNTLTIDGAAHTNGQPVSLSPYGGIQSGINGQWLAQSVSASAGSLVVDGVTITPPKALYLSPAGKLTATPNGRPVATVRA